MASETRGVSILAGRRLWIVAGVLALGIASWILLPPEGAPRKRAMPPCRLNVRAIGHALNTYESNYGCLPPPFTMDKAGRAMHSWRALIAPYLRERWEAEANWLDLQAAERGYWESRDFSRRADAARKKAEQLRSFLGGYDFSEPWDSPGNRAFATMRMDAFCCPNDPRAQSGKTNYVVVVGDQTAWRPNRPTRDADFRDGTVRTALVVEIADSTIPWTQPVDLPFSDATFESGNNAPNRIGSPYVGEANYLFRDGAVRCVRHPGRVILKGLFTIDGGEADSDSVLGF